MISLQNYQNNHFNYYNSLSSSLNDEIPLTESLLVKKHGKAIDSVIYKLDLCSYREYNQNNIFENYNNVLFTIDEQYAARDLLLLTCKEYIESLCEEYNIGIPVLEGNGLTSIKSFINNVQDTVKQKADQFKQGLSELGEKLKAIKEFVKNIVSNAINSAKELVDKFLQLIESVKDSLGNILSKLGGKIEEIQKEYSERIEEVIKNKAKRPKDTIYENIQNYLNNNEQINEDIINEFLGFGKKKKEAENKKSNNEYDKSLNKDNSNTKSKGGKGNLLLSILKQVAISVSVLILIPALIGCAWGPAAAMIAATIAKAAMTAYGFWKLCKNIYLTIKSDKWKNAGKWKKLGYIFLWIVSIALLAWGAKKAGEDIIKCWDAFSNGNLKQLVPDETIQGAMKLINKVWKALTGNDTAGYEELVKLTAEGGVIDKWDKLEETKDKTADNFTDKQLKNLGDTNDWNNIETNLGKETSDALKNTTDAALKSSKSFQDATIDALQQNANNIPSDVHVLVLDGNTVGKMMRDGLLSGANGQNIAVNQLTNTAIQTATNGQAGTLYMLAVKGTKEFADSIATKAGEAAAAHGVDFLGKVISGTATETITKMIPHHLPLISGGFAPIVGLPTIFKKKVNKGFLLRLGSSRSGNNIYPILEDGIEGMKFSELESKYGDKNSSVINNMKKIINTNYKTLENAHKELESKKDLSKEEKKRLNAITKQLEKMKDGIDDYECLVFYAEKKIEAENAQANEGFIDKLFNKNDKPKVKKIEKQPVMFINPLCMACGDLADSTKKRGPRKKPIYLKGLFASYEFLPGEEGMNEKEIDEMLTNISLDCLKTAWNMTADSPCIKKKFKDYVENDESIYKGKERDDFGKFTNTEITEIFNDPSSISKYMSGSYSKRSTVEKENTEHQKQRKENAKKEWKDNIENNEEVKKLIDQCPSLKKNLMDGDKVKPEALDELVDPLLRMETSYNKGKSKKSLWSKIKSWFKGDDENKSKYDQEEVQKLAYKLASLHKEKLKSKRSKETVKESIEELDYMIKCFEMNMNDLMAEEFTDFIETNQINEINYDNKIELNYDNKIELVEE